MQANTLECFNNFTDNGIKRSIGFGIKKHQNQAQEKSSKTEKEERAYCKIFFVCFVYEILLTCKDYCNRERGELEAEALGAGALGEWV